MFKVGIGQDSHRFELNNKTNKNCILGGVIFENVLPFKANSDGDVIFHSITNAISGVTGVNILGKISDKMCLEDGIVDSKEYLLESLKYLNNYKIIHLSISIECLKPKITPKIPLLKESISKVLNLSVQNIGITATTGEGLTGFGKGEGVQVLSIVTVAHKELKIK